MDYQILFGVFVGIKILKWSREIFLSYSPCEGYSCPDFAKCADKSTDTDAKVVCECQMGRVLLPETGQCIEPLPPPPTPRPIPELPVAVKAATTAITKSASSLIVIFVGSTLGLFVFFRIYDIARVIQMNMELALIFAHICLIVPDMTAEIEVVERFNTSFDSF